MTIAVDLGRKATKQTKIESKSKKNETNIFVVNMTITKCYFVCCQRSKFIKRQLIMLF